MAADISFILKEAQGMIKFILIRIVLKVLLNKGAGELADVVQKRCKLGLKHQFPEFRVNVFWNHFFTPFEVLSISGSKVF